MMQFNASDLVHLIFNTSRFVHVTIWLAVTGFVQEVRTLGTFLYHSLGGVKKVHDATFVEWGD